MPGLVGFSGEALSSDGGSEVLQTMRDLITHDDFCVRDPLFCVRRLCATRSHTNIIQREPQPYQEDGTSVWLDGEFFNEPVIHSLERGSPRTQPGILRAGFAERRDFSFLGQLDGVFSAVVYDSAQEKTYLVTDRYGLRHLYWTIYRQCLVWSSEVKAMLALPGFEPEIDMVSLKQFLEVGHLLGERTWFQNVQLVPPGTVLEWDMRTQSLEKHRYWWWDELKPLIGPIDEREIAEELGRLFVEAVARRCREGEKLGIMLSGGLDSRAVLAAVPDWVQPLHAMTFGQPGCEDMKIAPRVSGVKGAIHHSFDIDAGNWFYPRLKGVWWTDGQLNLMDMHGIEARDVFRNLFQINLSGFAGDVVLGADRLLGSRFFDLAVSRDFLAALIGCDGNVFEDVEQYRDLKKTDFYILQNEVRRFNFCGVKFSLTAIEVREPFYDNKLIEFVYSLPDSLRYQSRIYMMMLLRKFPDFFRRIPWQRTGLPIVLPHKLVRVVQIAEEARRDLLRSLARVGIKYSESRVYADYESWLRLDPARSFLSQLLSSPDALYGDYVSREVVRDTLTRHMNGEDFARKLSGYLTFEVWLQQLFKKRYRD